MAKPELRRRIEQRAVLEQILRSLELEPDPVREDRVRASIAETDLRIESLKRGAAQSLEQARREVARLEREAQEADRG